MMQRVYSFEEALQESLTYFKGDDLAAKAFLDKYALKNEEGKLVESNPDQMHRRIAKEFARIEAKKFKVPLTEEFIYGLLKDFKYVVPQGSPMFAIGNYHTIASISNCFVLDTPDDSYNGIMRTDHQLVQICKRRGGVGLDISKIRPRGFSTRNSSRTSTGIIPFMERYSNSIREVGQDGRRGALMISISVHHPEVLEFAKVKKDKTKVTGANISIRLSDEFLTALKNNEDYEQRFPVDSATPIFTRMVSAKKVFEEIIESAWEMAEPGLLFWDRIIKNSPADCYAALGFATESTNPCGEIPLCPKDSCRLLVLNLFSYITDPFTKKAKFDTKLFVEHGKIAQRLMDDIIDLELECIDRIIAKVKSDPESEMVKEPEITLWKGIREKCSDGRRTGLGLTAVGDSLAALNIGYATKESVAKVEEIYRTLKLASYTSSMEMAKELGAFPIWNWELEKNCPFIKQIELEDPELFNNIKKYGRRNIANLTTAPTGTVSIMTQTSSGIEPLFMLSYTRNRKVNENDGDKARVDFTDQNGDKWQKYVVYHPKLKQWMDVTGETDETKSPWYGYCANDLDWENRVKLQAAAQRHIDHSISSTLNLPNNVTQKQVAVIYQTAWEAGCKGITIYRDGCRTGVLVANDKKGIAKTKAPKRLESLPCDIYCFKVDSKEFFVAVGLLEGEPYEVFASKRGKLDKTIKHGNITKLKRCHYSIITENNEDFIIDTFDFLNDTEQAITRLVSCALRHGADVAFIVDQLEKTDGNISSFSKSVARALKKYIKDGTKAVGSTCATCKGTNLVRNSGCVTCMDCGWSKCG